ncbi:hypothetical protein G6F25_014057 [Rhizopus arrhizus]|nr:hypothetical protein G6F31_015884 [Rhizopus arrhizus]KAG1016602.1 hypothetical protein G6F25_014057 [Rhizopus arrhizus]
MIIVLTLFGSSFITFAVKLTDLCSYFRKIRLRWCSFLTHCKRALPAVLRQEVSRSLLNLGRDQQDSVAKVAAKARMVLSSNLCSEISPSPRQASVPVKSSSLSLL